MTLGTELRQAREARGLSLRELSERTQIRQPVLRAIESDDFRHLPGGVIMRGFLKLYAREIGLDPDEIAGRYTTQLEATAPDRPGEEGAATRGGPSAPRPPARFARAGGIAGLAVLALLVVAYLASRPSQGPTADARDQPVSETAAPAETPSAAKPAEQPARTASPPAETATAVPPATAAAAADTSAPVLRVDLHATGPCWISATADGQQVASRLMNPGDRLAIPVTDLAVLRIGFPGNLTVTINDQPLRPFERPGTPTTLRITPANYRDLILR